MSPGTPLAALVRPHEDHLIVESTKSRPLRVLPPKGVSTIEWKSKFASAVVLADAVEVLPQLTAAEDWIVSVVSASVTEILKPSQLWNVQAGTEFSFVDEGGELLVGGTRVTALLPWSTPVEAGKRYLIFVSIDPSTKKIVVGAGSVYEVSGSRLVRLAAEPSGQDDIERIEASEVFGRIRDLNIH